MGGGAQPPIEITLDATGPSADKMSDILNPRSAITSPGSAAGLGRVLEPLLRVPGRELKIGEMWVDTYAEPEVAFRRARAVELGIAFAGQA